MYRERIRFTAGYVSQNLMKKIAKTSHSYNDGLFQGFTKKKGQCGENRGGLFFIKDEEMICWF